MFTMIDTQKIISLLENYASLLPCDAAEHADIMEAIASLSEQSGCHAFPSVETVRPWHMDSNEN